MKGYVYSHAQKKFRITRKRLLISGALASVLVIWLSREFFVQFFFRVQTRFAEFFALSSFEAQILLFISLLSLLFGVTAFLTWTYYEKMRAAEIAEQPPSTQEVMKALAVSARQLQLLYDNGPVPYFIMDDDGNVRNPNKATTRFFALASDGTHVSSLYDQIVAVRGVNSREAIDLFVKRASEGGR